ncbi:hypothetical protein ACWDRX_19805, partial [Streptomyces nigra]
MAEPGADPVPNPSPVRDGDPDGGRGKPDAAVVRDALGVGVAVGLSGFAFGVTSAGSGLTLAQGAPAADLREGSLFEPLKDGETYDLIVS